MDGHGKKELIKKHLKFEELLRKSQIFNGLWTINYENGF
jgi:hypothetical protein